MIAEIVRHSAHWETKQTFIFEAKISGFEEILVYSDHFYSKIKFKLIDNFSAPKELFTILLPENYMKSILFVQT